MRLCIAGIESQISIIKKVKPPNVLFSFLNAKPEVIEYVKSADCEFYLCDSGAFTFINGKKNINFDMYVDKYIDFINQYQIQHFFELDIDSIVGLQKVELYRRKIENKTGRQCIPVWHRERGKKYFDRLCDEYSYIAIGGIAIKHIKKSEHKYFPYFIDTAHKHGAKIHGLGFTDFKNIRNYKFDSIDSTSWLYGGKMGRIYTIRDGYPKQSSLRKEGYKVDGEKLNEHNLRLFMKYGETL